MNRIFLLVILGFCFVLLLLFGVGIYFYFPLAKPGKQVELTIEPGMTVRQVAKLLHQHRVIRHTRAFLLWVRLNKLERSIQAGKVVFYEYEGIIKAAKKLQSAEAFEIKITIPEGLIIEHIASRLALTFPIDTAEFIRLCYDQEFIRSLGLSVSSLEGYLFPDTYRIRPGTQSADFIRRFVSQFKNKYITLKPTEVSKKFSQHEMVTLASIVEKEATLAEERTHISGVFHNRLRLGIPLGADPTVRYFLKKFSGPLRVSELKNPSPYNTRVHAGLPPGPICSPGYEALVAALAPLETKDLYFVAKWDGSGAHDFSQTGAQHERKKREIRRMNELRKMKLKKKKKKDEN